MAETTAFEYIKNPQAELQRLPFVKTPFSVLPADDIQWRTVAADARKTYKKFQTKDDFVEDPHNLVSGTFNLINVLIEKNHRGKPIDTMVFLDKSARNAAFLFHVAWERAEKLLKEKGYPGLPPKPNIRFLNVGRFEDLKHYDEHANQELGAIYRPEDFLGRVLIIDEIVWSGGSLRRAGEAITAAGYHPKSLEAMANFENIPKWYGREEAKGVTEVGDISALVRYAMHHIKTEEKTSLLNAIRSVGWKKFMDIIEDSRTKKELLDSISQDKQAEVKNALEVLHNFSHRQHIHSKEDEIVRYLASLGGFLALSPTSEDKIATRQYREALKTLIEKALDKEFVRVANKRNTLAESLQTTGKGARRILKSILRPQQ